VQKIGQDLKESINSLLPPAEWHAPQSVPLLPDLLQLAADNRRLANFGECESLHCRLDALHNAVEQQKATENHRLQELKLHSLAEFAAGAGHEINNPLAVISGQAQYLLVSEQEPARQKALQTIVGQSQRIHETLRQLRQFARPQAPRKQPVDLGGLLSEVVASLQVLADDRQVRVNCENPAAELTLMVDPCQIRTALAALLRNGIEAAPAGGWASLRVERNKSGAVLAIVEDNGAGLSTNDREHLFDPFYSGRKAGRGRGLGLPTAWQLARLHGGAVRFEPSESGQTRFVLTLPADTVVEAPAILIHRDALNTATAPAKLECPIPAA
jgi:signal transduction histidine kinase